MKLIPKIITDFERNEVVSKTTEFIKLCGGWKNICDNKKLQEQYFKHACSHLINRKDYESISALFVGADSMGIWLDFIDLLNPNCEGCQSSIIMEIVDDVAKLTERNAIHDKAMFNMDFHFDADFRKSGNSRCFDTDFRKLM